MRACLRFHQKGKRNSDCFNLVNPVSGTLLKLCFKRHVIASDSLYYCNSSKLIGLGFIGFIGLLNKMVSGGTYVGKKHFVT